MWKMGENTRLSFQNRKKDWKESYTKSVTWFKVNTISFYYFFLMCLWGLSSACFNFLVIMELLATLYLCLLINFPFLMLQPCNFQLLMFFQWFRNLPICSDRGTLILVYCWIIWNALNYSYAWLITFWKTQGFRFTNRCNTMMSLRSYFSLKLHYFYYLFCFSPWQRMPRGRSKIT